jgi:uncharacterized protein YqhQ
MNKKFANVGGQAVLEGVMMRSPSSLAIAVRRPNKEIVVKEAEWRSIWNKLPFLKWPFLRGSVVMIEAMLNGMQALNFSAKEAMPEEESSTDDSGTGAMLAFSMIASVIFAILLFKFVPHMAATFFGKILSGHALTVDDKLYHLVDGFVKIIIFILYIVSISFLKDIKRVFEYHGAEHMSIYTYEAGEDLTVENARNKSTLHPRCGTSFLMVVILVFIIVSAIVLPFAPEWAKPGAGKPFYTHIILVLLKLPLLIPVAGISYEFNRFAGKHPDSAILKPFIWPGLAMQLLTTKKPSDDQLEVGLIALHTALLREQTGDALGDNDEPVVFADFNAFKSSVKDVKKLQLPINREI